MINCFHKASPDRTCWPKIAPEGWEGSPLLACFHPSPEQVFKELRIPKALAKQISVREGDEVEMTVARRRLIVVPRQVRDYHLPIF